MIDAKLQAEIARASRWPVVQPPVARGDMPRHIAIIMDGNGRWATAKGKVRVNGHVAGVDSVRAATRYCGQLKVSALTLYAFSSENWKRPQAEIRFLFRLLKKYLVQERAELIANGVRLTSIGKIEALPQDVQRELRLTELLTANGEGLNLCLALNYGAQDEITEAAKTLLTGEAQRRREVDLTIESFQSALFTHGMPPMDLLIRTAGERRLSNFLLWQARGAEFVAVPVCWPEFGETELREAIVEFAKRSERATIA